VAPARRVDGASRADRQERMACSTPEIAGRVAGRRRAHVPALRALLVAIALLTCGTSARAQTAVTLALRGPAQEAVAVAEAHLFITGWGSAERVGLPVDGNLVRLDLDATRPDAASPTADITAFVYVKAPGYAPLMSEAFTWTPDAEPILIDFRNGRRVRVARGARATLDVAMRRASARRVRIVDLDNRPVSGVSVEVAAYWPTPNYCGFTLGKDVLLTSATNDVGALDLPDVDGPYLFTLGEDVLRFAGGDGRVAAAVRPQELVAMLSGAESTFRVRRYSRVPLALTILSDGKPLPGVVLWSDKVLDTCATGRAPLATAAADGHLQADDFYPELWETYWLCAGGKQVWALPEGGRLPPTIDVSLTRGAAPTGTASTCER